MHSERVTIDENIELVRLSKSDHQQVRELMTVVYPPPYLHIWKDDASWYLEMVYNQSNFEKEIDEPDTFYYFIVFQNNPKGVLRICHNQPLIDFPDKKATKLHRIYIDQPVHGHGIGKTLIHWVEKQCISRRDEILWLEAMDTQEQALKFYQKNGFEICGSMTLDFDMMRPEYRGMYRLYKVL